MTKSQERKIKKEFKDVVYILDTVRNSNYYPRTATHKQWTTLINLHYKYVKNGKGTKECTTCKKYFKVCIALNNFRIANNL